MKAIEHLDLLGRPVKDKVTGLKGIVTSVDFDLFGCIQAIITPKSKDGETKNSKWVDISRLDVDYKKPRVMDLPDFTRGYVADGKQGCANKPLK